VGLYKLVEKKGM